MIFLIFRLLDCLGRASVNPVCSTCMQCLGLNSGDLAVRHVHLGRNTGRGCLGVSRVLGKSIVGVYEPATASRDHHSPPKHQISTMRGTQDYHFKEQGHFWVDQKSRFFENFQVFARSYAHCRPIGPRLPLDVIPKPGTTRNDPESI